MVDLLSRAAQPADQEVGNIPSSAIVVVQGVPEKSIPQFLWREGIGAIPINDIPGDEVFRGLIMPDPSHPHLPAVFTIMDGEPTGAYVPFGDLIEAHALIQLNLRMFHGKMDSAMTLYHLPDEVPVGIEPGVHQFALLPHSPQHTPSVFVLLYDERHLGIDLACLVMQDIRIPGHIREIHDALKQE